MYACLHALLSTWLFNYYSNLDGCVEFETCAWTIFQNRIVFLYSYWYPVSVPFFCIRTDLLYQHYFPVLCYTAVNICCVTTWHLTPTCYHLTPVWYYLTFEMLLPDTCYAKYLTLVIITYGNDNLVYLYIPVHVYSWYSWSAPTHSRHLIIT